MTAALDASVFAAQPGPAQDRGSKPVPERLAEALSIAAILVEYGRHLAATIQHRAVWRGFATIAQFFGTATVSVILPQIYRGIMRAVALQRLLQARAKRGRDLVVLARRRQASDAAEPAAPPSPNPQPAEAQPARKAAARPPRRTEPDEPLTLDTLPTMAEIEAEVRRRPIGRTIAAICRDLGIAPTLCTRILWDRLHMAMHQYRGNLAGLVLEMRRREKQLDKDQWRHPNLALPEQTKEGVRRVLGFFIGEPLVDPFRPLPSPGAPVPAAATGPP